MKFLAPLFFVLQILSAQMPSIRLEKYKFDFPHPVLEKEHFLIKGECPKYNESLYLTEIEKQVKDVSLWDFQNLAEISDDMDRASLLKAIETNIRYWKTKPSSFKIKIGPDYYYRDHMLKTSMRLFELFSSESQISEIAKALKKEFKVYTAVSNDSYKIVTITGYYESQINVTKEKEGKSIYPIHAHPQDLVKSTAGYDFDYGRYNEEGIFVPYYTSEEIRKGAIDGKAVEIAYSAHPSHIMLAQIQGSSILKFPDGDYIRVGFAAAKSSKPLSDENGNLLGFKKFSRFVTAHDSGYAIMRTGQNRSILGIRDKSRNPSKLNEV